MSSTIFQRFKHISSRFTVFILLILVLTVALSSIYQVLAEVRDLSKFPPPGRLINVDGRMMHIHCEGTGSPTVVVEQGAGSMSVAWTEIHQQVAQTTRICSYDRAGLGYSEPVDRPMRSPEVAETLGKLLDTRGIEDDLVLVGWSAGGIYIREFYRQNQSRVKGMVFVESSHEQQVIRMPEEPPVSDFVIGLMKIMGPTGLLRLSGLIESQTGSLALTEESEQRLTALYSQSHSISSFLIDNEGARLDMQSNSPPENLGDLPITVISRGVPIAEYEGMPADVTVESMRELRRKWYELQYELVNLSSNSRHVIATKSGHMVHTSEPQLLVDSITDMVSLVKSKT